MYHMSACSMHGCCFVLRVSLKVGAQVIPMYSMCSAALYQFCRGKLLVQTAPVMPCCTFRTHRCAPNTPAFGGGGPEGGACSRTSPCAPAARPVSASALRAATLSGSC